MKLAISGKGGVGKTTFAGCLSKVLADNSYKVLAIDADPDSNLASALGFTEEELKKSGTSQLARKTYKVTTAGEKSVNELINSARGAQQ